MQIVDDVARAENEDTFVAKRLEPACEVEVICRGQGLIDAELDDRDVGLGEQVHEKGLGCPDS